jgi:hypothetical protein
MTPAVLDRPETLIAAPMDRTGRRPVTLEDRLSAALDEARANGSTECPVCHARMSITRAGNSAGAAECGSCGSRLS